MSSIIDIALTQFGVKEFKGEYHNEEVLKYFSATDYHSDSVTDETAWCSAFVNWVANKASYQSTKKLNARSWLEIGSEVKIPSYGDVVIFWRDKKNSWKGHVGFYIGEVKIKAGYKELKYILCLGGNQGNQVKVSAYPANRLLGYRELIKIKN